MEKYKLIIFFIIVLLLFGCAKNFQKTPQSTIETFIQNVKKLNEISPTTIKQAKKILKTLFSTEKAYEAFTTTFRNIEIEEYKIGEAKIEDATTAVPVKMKTKGLIGIVKEEEKEYTFNLEKKDSKWFIKDIAGILEHFEKQPIPVKGEERKEETK